MSTSWEAILALAEPGGLIVKDDLTPGRPIDGDDVREFLLRDPRLAAAEILATPEMAVIVAAVRSAEERARDVVPLARHDLQLGGRLGERDGDDVVSAQRGHLPELAREREVGRLEPEPRGEHAVARRSACRRAGRGRAR